MAANITEQKQFDRKVRIDEIANVIKSRTAITDEEEFLMQICVKYNVNERKAKEYLKIAKFVAK